jgi:hypothetical protein
MKAEDSIEYLYKHYGTADEYSQHLQNVVEVLWERVRQLEKRVSVLGEEGVE